MTGKELKAETIQAMKENDNWYTVIKIHTLTIGNNTMIVEEVKGGVIKCNGKEIFKSYDAMVSDMKGNVTIETEIIK